LSSIATLIRSGTLYLRVLRKVRYILDLLLSAGSRQRNKVASSNTLASYASDPGSTPGRDILELDRGYRPFGVGEM